jgi:hypothetical protein
MSRRRAALWISLVMTAATTMVVGCNDVGDSSAIPDEDANDSVGDGTVPAPDTGPVEAIDAISEATFTPDSGVVEDANTPESPVEDTGTVEDTGVGDTSSAVEDTGAPDSTVEDTGTPDSAVEDAGPQDTGVAVDASGGGGLLPCTTASQTGCVPCAGNATGICTPTEAAFVQQDIDQGNATAAGGDSATGCYPCLFMNGCIDDTVFPDTDHECGDLSGTFGAGAQSGTADSALCLDTLACILQTSCTAVAGTSEISNCYCGPTHDGTACASAGSAVNGACLTPEVNGLGFDVSDNTDILKNFTDTALPTGMANQILQCAISNACTACLQATPP